MGQLTPEINKPQRHSYVKRIILQPPVDSPTKPLFSMQKLMPYSHSCNKMKIVIYLQHLYSPDSFSTILFSLSYFLLLKKLFQEKQQRHNSKNKKKTNNKNFNKPTIWIPGHFHIPGNERPDTLAKNAHNKTINIQMQKLRNFLKWLIKN